MAEFSDRSRFNNAITLEQYRALDEAGKITKPITWGDALRVAPRAYENYAPSADDDSARRGDLIAEIVALRRRPNYKPPEIRIDTYKHVDKL